MTEVDNADVIQAWSTASPEAVEAHGDEGDFARQHLLNPVLFEMLGDVQGKQIVDAGCGQGYLCRLLAQRGARVTGIEPAEAWYRHAVAREDSAPLGITYLQQDLSTLHDLPTSFDCVVSNMVFMDIPDYEEAMRRCIALLKPGGNFIFSLTHPCFEEPASAWTQKGYVEVREYNKAFSRTSNFGFWFHRPLSSYLNLVIQAGCTLQRIVEPALSEEIVRQYGEQHVRNVHVPQFIVISAQKQR